jgi:ubiquinone/menaquinone biosynthesis C-methylase UbiE
LIYSYHVLEHVADPSVVLGELNRVLKPGGALFIGFPNKNRLLSYIGTSQKASALEKLKWNVNDYWFKLQGKFENRYGAHAGFSEAEFLSMARAVFSSVHPVRDRYMLYKYSGISWLIRAMIGSRTSEFMFPSNYFICMKGVS